MAVSDPKQTFSNPKVNTIITQMDGRGTMRKSDKILIGYILISAIAGLIGLALFISNQAQQQSISTFSTSIRIALSVIGVVAGVYMLKRKNWAYTLALFFFALQVPIFKIGSFIYSLSSGFQMDINFSNDQFGAGLNFLALAMLIWTYKSFTANKQIVSTQLGE